MGAKPRKDLNDVGLITAEKKLNSVFEEFYFKFSEV